MLLAAPVYAEVLLGEMIHIFPSFIYVELSCQMIRIPYKNSEGNIALIYNALQSCAISFDDDFYVD